MRFSTLSSASTATTTALLFLTASTSALAASPQPHLQAQARARALDLDQGDAAGLGAPESCAFPAANANPAAPCGGSGASSSKARADGNDASSASGAAMRETPIHLERSRESSAISLGKTSPHDPRSLRFQPGVFRSSTGKTGRSAYDLGIRPREALAYERSPLSSETAATVKVQQYAPSPAAPHLAANAAKGAAAGEAAHGIGGHGTEEGLGRAGAPATGGSATAHLPSSPSGTHTTASTPEGTSVPPLPFFPYSTSPMLSDADYRLPTFASKPRYRTNPPPIHIDDALHPDTTEVTRAKPRHKLMSKLAWNRLPSWSRVLLEDAVTLLNVPDAQGKVRRRSRNTFTGKWWRWAYGRGWIYGWSRDWSALESGRGPGVALAHLLPDRQVWTATPPRMHWRFMFIASIAIPTFLGLIVALLLIQWLFFPHTLDFSKPVGDGYIYIGLPSSETGTRGPTLPFSNKRSRSRSPSGGSSSHGHGKHLGRRHSAASSQALALGTGAEAGPSNLLRTRRSPNLFRGRSANAISTMSTESAVEIGLSTAGSRGFEGIGSGKSGEGELLPLTHIVKSSGKKSPPTTRGR
ncbi:hypothetical protein V8E36_009133 [Tilletia maclaganii]